MRFIGIVASGLVLGSYYIGGGASDINAFRTSKFTWVSVRTSQRTLRAWSKTRSLRKLCMSAAVYCGIVNN